MLLSAVPLRMKVPAYYPVFLFLLCSWLDHTAAISSMAIDLGSDSMKVAVVLPKIPMEIALDGHAKRKTPTAVGFREGERVFGADAVNMASIRPSYVYQSFASLIGKHIDHPAVKLYQQRYPYHNLTYHEPTGQLVFHHPEGMSFTIEELVAMLLEYARAIAEHHTGSSMKTCVVTVPSFYGQAERASLMRAVQLAGLELQQLINVNTAVALNFGIFRRSSFTESAQHFIFFDVGYISTTATVVSYQVGKHHQGGVSARDPILSILGVGSVPNLGTSSLIYRIRDYFAQAFSESSSIPLTTLQQNARVMSRLLKEATRVFMILSANTEANAQLERLLNEKDFRLLITREQMETLCEKEFNQFRKPFTEALTLSGIDMSVIQGIVLMGGGTRIPKVQEILMDIGQRAELSKGLNNDEAAVMGAVYQAAFHTPGFRVLPFVVKDYNTYPIAVDFKRAPQINPTEEKSDISDASSDVRRVVFPRGNPFPQKRAITFNRHTTDLTFYVNYVDLTDEQSVYIRMVNLTQATTEGVTKAVEKYPGSELRGVKAHLNLDYSGLLSLTGVDCLFHPTVTPDAEEKAKDESTLQKLGNTISGFFGVGGNKKDKGEEEKSTATENATSVPENEANSTLPLNGTEANGTSSSNETAQNVNQTENTKTADDKASQTAVNKTKLKPFTERIGFKLEVLYTTVPSDEDIKKSMEKLRQLREVDQAKREREQMANELESSIFTMREHVDTDVYIKHSTTEERERLSEMLTQALEWFEEQDNKTPKEVYEEKLLELRRVYVPIHSRVTETERRPFMFQELNKTINEARTTLVRMRGVNDVLYKLDQSMREKTKLEQQDKQEEVTSKEQPSVIEEPTTESHTSVPPSPIDDVTVTEGNKTVPTEAEINSTSTEQQKSQPAFVPLFPNEEIDSLEKSLDELSKWMKESIQRLNQTAPHQTPPVLVEDIQAKRNEMKSKLSPFLSRLNLFQSEVERTAQAQKQKLKTSQKQAKTSDEETRTDSGNLTDSQPEIPVETEEKPKSEETAQQTVHIEL